ncbi:MAG: Crp/Fnr family transcriptional regulator [Acidobacteriota bacterium]
METKELIELLREHAFLERFKPEHVQKFAELAREVRFVRDQIIFREGEECGLFYLILSGRVALEVSAPGCILRVLTLEGGEQLGWSSVLEAGGKHFQARSLEAVRALVFDGARLREACDQDPEFGYALMTQLLQVVAERLQATRLQLMDIYRPRAVKLI